MTDASRGQEMSGFTENAANDASERPDRQERFIDLSTAQRMLPLVRRIVADLVQHNGLLAQLRPEQAYLQRHRRELAWPQRARRYELNEEVQTSEQVVQEAYAELEVLGVVLLEADSGRIGFPMIVNQQAAFFSWRLGEESIQ